MLLMPCLPNRHSTLQETRNQFIETALAYALTYISTLNHFSDNPISITILADSDYYSHRQPADPRSRSPTDRFIHFGVKLHDAHKTGLGSSAALVTALTAGVLAHYVPQRVLDVTSEQGSLQLHNLAQAAHCAAQGKVGSGFDVAAAVHGSCVYKRFSPSVLSDLGGIGIVDFAIRLKTLVEDAGPTRLWDTEVDKGTVVLPKGLDLLMCDVDCGSGTVAMVRNVLAWRERDREEASIVWNKLQKANQILAAALRDSRFAEGERRADYKAIRNAILETRSMIREMSWKSKVAIEPEAQKILINACSELDGVVGGVVPGAGGFDAIALIVEDRPGVLERIEQFCENYRFQEKGNREGKIRLLSVKQDDKGIVQEDIATYRRWTHVEL